MKNTVKNMLGAVLGIGLALQAGCTRKSVDPGDSTSDQEALLNAYRSLETVLEAKSSGTGGLSDLVSDSYLDEGADKAALLAEADIYFAASGSIRVSLNTQGMVPRVVRDRAMVAESLKIESYHASIPGSVLVEWCTGTAYWIMEDGAWRLYGDQADSTPDAAVEVEPRPDTSPLTDIFGPAGMALGLADAVIANALFDSGGTDMYSGAGWPAVFCSTYYSVSAESVFHTAAAGGSVVTVFDSVHTETTVTGSVIVDYDSLDAAGSDGITRTGSIRIGSVYGDSAGIVDIGFVLRSCKIGSSSVSGSGTVTGFRAGGTDSLRVKLSITVDTLVVSFDGSALVNTGNTGDRADDIIAFSTGSGTNRVVNGSADTWNMTIFGSTPPESRYGMGLTPAPSAYPVTCSRFGTYPVSGCVFTDTLAGNAFGAMAYAELLDDLNDGWINPATGEAYPESVAVHYTEERRHRKGAWGISGFIDDGFDVMPIIPDEVRGQERAGHTFLGGGCYGYPAHTAGGGAAVRLMDVTAGNYTVVDTSVSLQPN